MSNEANISSNEAPNTPAHTGDVEPRFEQAISELEQIVTRLGQPNINLDEALTLYERGVELTRRGRTLISDAEGRVSQLRQSLNQPHQGGPDAPRS